MSGHLAHSHINSRRDLHLYEMIVEMKQPFYVVGVSTSNHSLIITSRSYYTQEIHTHRHRQRATYLLTISECLCKYMLVAAAMLLSNANMFELMMKAVGKLLDILTMMRM